MGLLLLVSISACRRTIERAEPLKYLNITSDHHTNLLGQTVIEGSISNTATSTTYKDVDVQISYISETDAVIGTEDQIFYVYVPPRKPFAFKIKTDAPAQTATVKLKIVTAKTE
ncbi:hypothetical protein DN068_19420 [Taibaiella soli]|uniref:Uncharacterized protein n=2 Tax=Taibaiella soli TaxID=1649169 RepID=A0A2W2ATW2_9BACT|nr:hypothetical protein DN068_19420 [Taibaiella soli]